MSKRNSQEKFLLNRGKVPKYLEKRKIELIKQKVLLRKYGYLFYRKTLSYVLPSESRKYYSSRLLLNAFCKWKEYWFSERVVWRLEIRANLHYVYTLKRNTLRLWQYFVIERKENCVKLEIAKTYYDKKMKMRYFFYLKNNPKVNKEEMRLFELYKKYSVYLFLNINIAQLLYKYYKKGRKYNILLLFSCFKTKIYFKKLHIYAAKCKVKKSNNVKVKKFIRAKYKPEQIRSYYENWRNFAKESVNKACKTEKAERFRKIKLEYKAFKIWYQYKKDCKNKTKNRIFADVFYLYKLYIKIIAKWKIYTVNKIVKNNGINFARDYYENTLKFKYLKNLYAHRCDRKRLKKIQAQITEKLQCKSKAMHFQKLKKYTLRHKTKRQKQLICTNLYEKKLKNRCFLKLKHYVPYRREKTRKRNELIENSRKKHNSKLLKAHFTKWRIYESHLLEKRLKILIAEKNCKIFLMRKSIRNWKERLAQKRLKEQRYVQCKHYCENKLLNNAYCAWKKYANEEKLYREKLAGAKELHRKSLLRMGIRTILLAAFAIENQQQARATNKFEKTFYVALKYFKIWKYKALYKETTIHQHSQIKPYVPVVPKIAVDYHSFKWDPLCFEKPRIPDYLKSTLNL